MTYYTVESVFDISDYLNYPIEGMDLYIYQRGNFKDANGNMIPAPTFETGFSDIFQNIWVKDPYICLGASLAGFDRDTAEIYCSSGDLTYSRFSTSDLSSGNVDISS